MNKLRVVSHFISKRFFLRHMSRKALEKRQQRMLRRHLRYVRRHSAFYGQIMDDNTVLTDLPIMDKTSMMENFNTLNTVGVDRDTALSLAINAEKTRDFSDKYKNITVGLSSGTSGNRGMFLVSPAEQEAWAGSILAKLLPEKHILGHRVALFLRANSDLYQSIGSSVIAFRYFDILRPVESFADQLNEYAPTIIAAPPSVLRILAEMIRDGRMENHAVKVFSIAEVLEAEDAALICEAFEIPYLHQIYQCTEGFLGHTCRCGGFHINEDVVFMEKEYLDEDSGRFVPIITDFCRTAQPIIRYRLNDVLIEDPTPCACGSACMKIKAIEGRTDDIFLFPAQTGEGYITVYSDFIRRCVLFSGVGKEYQVVQLSASQVEIRFRDQEDIQPFTRELQKLAEEMGFVMPQVTAGSYEQIPGKKLKRVESRFRPF